MSCLCPTCQRLSKRTLSELPDHAGRPQLVLDLCSGYLELVRTQRWDDDFRSALTFENTPSQYGMPSVNYLHEGAEFSATLMAFAIHMNMGLQIKNSKPEVYIFTLGCLIPSEVPLTIFPLFGAAYHHTLYAQCNTQDILKRDTVMSHNILLDDSKMPELLLLQHLVAHRVELLPACKFLYDCEWEPYPGRSDKGTGDAVFTNGRGVFVIVEVKHLNLSETGVTARRRRTKKRKQVVEQAIKYASLFRKSNPSALCVIPATFTNEDEQVQLVSAVDKRVLLVATATIADIERRRLEAEAAARAAAEQERREREAQEQQRRQVIMWRRQQEADEAATRERSAQENAMIRYRYQHEAPRQRLAETVNWNHVALTGLAALGVAVIGAGLVSMLDEPREVERRRQPERYQQLQRQDRDGWHPQCVRLWLAIVVLGVLLYCIRQQVA